MAMNATMGLSHYQRIGLAAVTALSAFLVVAFAITWHKRSAGFPTSGTVSLTRAGQMVKAQSHLRVVAGPEDLVVQLFNARTKNLYATVYAAADKTVNVQVPAGLYRVRLVRGARWESAVTLFGNSNAIVEITTPLVFTPKSGQLVGLVEPGEGNLPGRLVRPKDPLTYR